MRYLCMICYEQKTLDSFSQPEFDVLVAESLAYDDELRDGGHYLYSVHCNRCRQQRPFAFSRASYWSRTVRSPRRKSISAALLSSTRVISTRRSGWHRRSRRHASGPSRSVRSKSSNRAATKPGVKHGARLSLIQTSM